VTAEATELSDREAALAPQNMANVALVEASGGEWDASLLPVSTAFAGFPHRATTLG